MHCGDTEIRVWHVPGKERLTGFALEAARETLARLEHYFDLPYPYAKLDLVAVPDFEAGAMENAGAVFFRETLLLVDPRRATLAEKKRVAEVICHELAHMWYGDLVTMAWWDDLWLNEAFATWMAFQIVDEWKPEWRMWHDFEHHRAAALGARRAREHAPDLRRGADAERGDRELRPDHLREGRVGRAHARALPRRRGVPRRRARYIRAHREANAVAADLWRALERGVRAATSSRSCAPGSSRPGFPLLRAAARASATAGAAALRAGALPRRARARAARGARRPVPWPIPWVGAAHGARHAARAPAARRSGAREIDARRRGAALRLRQRRRGRLLPRRCTTRAELRALARRARRARAGRAHGPGRRTSGRWRARRARALASFLDLALALGDEREPDVLAALRGPLALVRRPARRADAGAAAQAALRARDRRAPSGRPSRELGWDAGAARARRRRGCAAPRCSRWSASVAEAPERARRGARRAATRYLADRRSLEPNLARRRRRARRARRRRGAASTRFLARCRARRATPQERRRFLLALGEFRDPTLVERALALALTDACGTQDVALLLARLLANRAARERAWAFCEARWAKLRAPHAADARVAADRGDCPRSARARTGARWRRSSAPTRSPTGARALRQALERFDLERSPSTSA